MFILKNAWRSVTRNKGRNILIVIIVAIIAAAATIGLAIRNAAETAREEGLSSTTVTATIGMDREQVISQATEDFDPSEMEEGGQPDFDSLRSALDQDALTLDEYDAYAEASSVPVSTYYTESTSVNGTDAFQPVESSSSADADSSDSSDNSSTEDSSDDASSDSSDGTMPSMPGGDMGGMMGGMSSGDFSLTGFSSDTAVANASNGSFTMSDGEVFGYDESSDGDVIIPKALADFNGLEVGDTISVADTSDDGTTYELTIVGIYKNATTSNTGANGPMGGTSQDPDNAIYTSVSTLESLGLSTESAASSTDEDSSDTDSTDTSSTSSASATQLSYTYVLSSKDDYETFAADAKAAGLSDEYTVSSADVEEYESSLVPLDNLASFALTLLLIVLAVGAVVLIVLNLFNVRERKYEVGVLTAIGIRKSKVAAQFVLELLIVTMIGIALGVAGGAVASVPVANQLLAQQVSAQESEATSQQAQFGRDADMPGAPGGQGGPDSSDSASDDAADSDTDSSESGSDATAGAEGQPSDAPGGGFGGFSQAVDYVSDIDATVNLKVIGQLVLIGLALTVISALAAVVSIIRYEPLQILADRS
ncbi:ABC transporter permease [Bifidobacterium eulemuris]|uniref:ABC transporter permease n=1 Tax=Bifidobacterium eulemuris TaxID=1765219 RepID=A0A261G7C4_9BIFI|nr:ABC transporter permease [Bifidobacterium eulemuris]OZG67347.1 ABC transporter permease [Bifidobacterium eulemuris]QOL32925.1 ABC transporter permease [Bifidobacterium eulemuris]